MDACASEIIERLEQARAETQVLLTVNGRPNILEMRETSPSSSHWRARRDLDRYLDEGSWKSTGPAFRELQDWLERHWNPGDAKPVPDGTVATQDPWLRNAEAQLDAATAARKLIAAARLYGSEEVGRYATDFAAHGMIEVHHIYLLKGPPIQAAKPLDECCMLLPYDEALRRIQAASDAGDPGMDWPDRHAQNVCALHVRYFENGDRMDGGCKRYTSPLLRDGPEVFALLLGLVWGTGFRVFGSWHSVPAAAAAALPYRHATWGAGSGIQRVDLAIEGFGPPAQKRPLAGKELRNLATRYSALRQPDRSRIRRAMARLRNSTERVAAEDRTIDLGIGLEILFTEEDEPHDRAELIPPRAAWHFADSGGERRQVEELLRGFLAHESRIVRGRTVPEQSPEEHERALELLSGADDVLRSSLKALIAEGWPRDWTESTDRAACRNDPPRAAAEIPSVKSDSLSWSVSEQDYIDQVLEGVWKPVVEVAPVPPAGEGPTTVMGLTPEGVEGYRDRGIPYVVLHPARLYLAHPRWPRSASEPLDERLEYYCALDVARHMRAWKEAAHHKGLVQFEVPIDPELYHPKNRDSWHQPILSSHEQNSIVRNPSPPTIAGEVGTSHRSPLEMDTAQLKRAAVEEKSTAPPPKFPASAMTGLEEEWFRLWRAFQHDVDVATNSLLCLLDAIHSIHKVERQRVVRTLQASDGTIKTFEDAVRASGEPIPAYPQLRASPCLVGEPLLARTAPGGPMEQNAFKGWIAEVYDRWESVYRNQLKHEAREVPRAIRPRQQVLGDLRHIRNNLVHKGIAKRGGAADCEILRWFAADERMQVRLVHVFDFLNQMGWLNEDSFNFFAERATGSFWHINRTGEPQDPPPALISVRPVVNPEQEDPRHRYEASIVFEDGLFGRTPMGPENEESQDQAKERTRRWMKMTVNKNGDLEVPGLGTVSAGELYRVHLKGEKSPAPGIWQPPVQFAE